MIVYFLLMVKFLNLVNWGLNNNLIVLVGLFWCLVIIILVIFWLGVFGE